MAMLVPRTLIAVLQALSGHSVPQTYSMLMQFKALPVNFRDRKVKWAKHLLWAVFVLCVKPRFEPRALL